MKIERVQSRQSLFSIDRYIIDVRIICTEKEYQEYNAHKGKFLFEGSLP